MRLIWRGKLNAARSAVIGTLVAILPGAGGSIASLVSYSEARRTSKRSDNFGHGEPDGVIATETANNATVGGGFIPTFVLGIPGTPPDAVILGALLVQGFRTGPEMFTTNASVTYTFIGGLVIATLLMLPIGLLIGRYAFKSIVSIPKALLVPSIAFMTVIGTYAIRNNPFDVVVMVVLGVIGWVLSRYGIKPSPIVLGLILGPIAEQGFVQGYLMGNASGSVLGAFFGRPLSLAIIAMVLLSVLYPIWRTYRARRLPGNPRRHGHEDSCRDPGPTETQPSTEPRPSTEPTERITARGSDACLASVTLVVALGALWFSADMSIMASVFPRTIALLVAIFSVALLLRSLLMRPTRPRPEPGSVARRLALIAVLLVWSLTLKWLGFLASSLLSAVCLVVLSHYHAWTPKRAAGYAIVLLLIIGLFYGLFAIILNVPLPDGLLWRTL